ncbi:transcription factor JAMYB [Brachypodium distachyon]|uniref:Uncharacterized protein n=1 Tax=Brachypodium distachyon TaxID=15368 RepID=A0A0Q3QM17_BRADI|nr:transcription factor JAMYB [Brachypodium distachyon]KQK02514.1 hypothetical protein BRADI_2g01960v3 [Brachypodium distachyon]|eukprot:XP_014754278.1 transcription factor JAMYB [Brachypodium distachyon]
MLVPYLSIYYYKRLKGAAPSKGFIFDRSYSFIETTRWPTMSRPRKAAMEEEDSSTELRRGPWTLEEDNLLMSYIACHGEGRWNLLARCSGLKRTGKSCRLRWLNYLKPDIKRGNLTAEEQLLILELHAKWGNRWSRIAQHLPGRTDNEIKNYWRTRVQKQARQLNVDANSPVFRDAVRCYWMPRLLDSQYMAAFQAQAQAAHTPESGTTMQMQQQEQQYNCCYPVENHSPSTATASTSGGGGGEMATAAMQQQQQAAVLPVPCFSELNWDLDDYPAAAMLGSSCLGLDGLDLGPAQAHEADSTATLLDYVNHSSFTYNHMNYYYCGGAMDDDGGDHLLHGSTTSAARKLGEWGSGGI